MVIRQYKLERPRKQSSDSHCRDQLDSATVFEMAPTMNTALMNPYEDLNLNHKLRKPVVEKLRRERINSSIEQLKSLLGSEFIKQQPDSKLEKADILEMTVCFLSQLLNQSNSQKTLSFRDADFSPVSSTNQTSITKEERQSNSALWRPW